MHFDHQRQKHPPPTTEVLKNVQYRERRNLELTKLSATLYDTTLPQVCKQYKVLNTDEAIVL